MYIKNDYGNFVEKNNTKTFIDPPESERERAKAHYTSSRT